MTLIDDVVLLAHYAQETARRGGGPRDELSQAADRVLSAHEERGLSGALLSESITAITDKMTAAMRQFVEAMAKEEDPDGARD